MYLCDIIEIIMSDLVFHNEMIIIWREGENSNLFWDCFDSLGKGKTVKLEIVWGKKSSFPAISQIIHVEDQIKIP